jgi:hypothetical protein
MQLPDRQRHDAANRYPLSAARVARPIPEALRPQHSLALWSRNAFQVWRHDAILSQYPREMDDFQIADSIASASKAQCLDGNVQPEFVSILETVN